MPNKQGTVATCNYKNIQTKRGTSQIWSFKLEEDGEYYSCNFDKPVRPDGIKLLAGDKVRFSFEENQYGKQVDMKSLQVKAVAEPSQEKEEPKRQFGGSKKSFGGGQKDDYWAKKEQFDKTVTQPLIMRQSANNVAANLVVAALTKDVLPLPSKKADKFEAYMLCYEQVRNEVFKDMMANYAVLQEGGSIIPLSNVTDEEDPTSEEWKEMDDFEEETKVAEESWGDDWEDK